MTEQQPKTPAQGTKTEQSAISMVLAGAKEAIQGMKDIFQNYQEGPKGTTLGDQDRQMKDAEDKVYRAAIILDAVSRPTEEAAQIRPSEKSSDNIRKSPKPEDDAAKERLVRWQNSELKENEVSFFKHQCDAAKFLLSAIKGAISKKPSAEECDNILKTLVQAQGDLVGPRRMLVGLKGYEIPKFQSQQVDKADATKIMAQFDDDIDKAISNVEIAHAYCKSDAANPDFKPFAVALDFALKYIAQADAALKCYEESIGKKPAPKA